MATTEDWNAASWNDAEVEAFLDYLLANKSKMGESGSYPKVVFNSAAIKIAEHHTLGPPKTGKHCQLEGKWTAVCFLCFFKPFCYANMFSVKDDV